MALYKPTAEIVIKLMVQHVCNDGNNTHLMWLLLDLEKKLYQLIVLLPCSKTFQTQDRIAVTNQSSGFTVNDYDLCWVCTAQSATTCCHDFFCCDNCAGLYCTQVSDKPHFQEAISYHLLFSRLYLNWKRIRTTCHEAC